MVNDGRGSRNIVGGIPVELWQAKRMRLYVKMQTRTGFFMGSLRVENLTII